MKIIATLSALLAISSAGFAQDPNRNRMNEPYPEVQAKESAGAPPAKANRMNVEYSQAPVSELAGAPNPAGNRMNDEWATPEGSAQADKAGKLKRR
jgi:hypothetical protein